MFLIIIIIKRVGGIRLQIIMKITEMRYRKQWRHILNVVLSFQ